MTPRQSHEPRGGTGGVEAFWECWVVVGCPLSMGQGRGNGLAGLEEMGKAFSCFAEVASVGPSHQGRPWTWPPPARLPASPS